MRGVSVALPVYRDSGTLGAAIGCITAQTLPDLEILLVLNGSDRPTRDAAYAAARSDPRVRVVELPEPNLAAACNVALEAARFELVARMDADDLCARDRLAVQAEYLERHPEIAATGSAWELIEGDRVIATVRPPCEPTALRWRLLMGNVLAHGSMMLRRNAVLRAGGYDTRCVRAQDYELWLRLARGGGIGAVPDVLYQHRTRFAEDPGRSSAEQAAVAGTAMLDAWRDLPAAEGAYFELLRSAVANAVSREDGADLGEIERLLSAGATREGMMAWLWAQWHHPPAPRRVAEVCRRSRVREVGRRLRGEGVHSVWLWGAGDHTRWMLEHREDLGLEIAGVVDDALAGKERFGMRIEAPIALTDRDITLISSDWHEDAIWASSAAARARGVRVVRLYSDQ